MQLLHALCRVPAPSGNEAALARFVLDYVAKESAGWAHPPQVIAGEPFQDCILLVFGQPRTAVFAHLDSVGFTVRYGRELVRIGGPRAETGYRYNYAFDAFDRTNADREKIISSTFAGTPYFSLELFLVPPRKLMERAGVRR